MATYLDAQIGFAEETTFGTRVVPTRFAEFVTESLKLEVDRIESQGVRSGRRVLHRWHSGAQRVTGDIEIELAPQGTGLLFKHLFGAVSTTGSDPYTHTFTPGVIDGKSLTVQVGRTDLGGTTRAFDYAGCKFPSWELSAAAGELAMLTASIYGVHEETNQSLASASYASGLSPFVFTHGSLTLAGGAVDVREVSFAADNGLVVDRHRMSASNPARSKEPKEAALRAYTGTVVVDWNGLTDYGRYVLGTEAALVATFNAGASAQLTITTNVRFDGETPNFARDVIPLNLPFKCVSSTSDAAAITADLVNADSTP